jgi:ureidoglycolate lyase
VSTQILTPRPLRPADFAQFGDVVEVGGDHVLINDGRCKRFTDLSALVADGGRVGVSLFQSEVQALPYTCTLLERHPHGSQCFVPMEGCETLYIVAEDEDGTPVRPRAFVAHGRQAVNIAANTWHGVLTPLSGGGLYTVIDRVDGGPNLEEHSLARALTVVPGAKG